MQAQNKKGPISFPDERKPALSGRPRIVLTSKIAREIFQLKATHDFGSLHSASLRLASKYGVSSKAIRDIWNGRSWLEATYDLWNVEERPARRVMGRPKGKKDSKPRTRGGKFHSEIEMPQLHDLSAISLGPHMTGMIGNQNNFMYNFAQQPTMAFTSAPFCDVQYQTAVLDCIRSRRFPLEINPSSLAEPLAACSFFSPYRMMPSVPHLPWNFSAHQQLPLFGTSQHLIDFLRSQGGFAPHLPALDAMAQGQRGMLAERGSWAALAPLAPARCD